MSDFGNVLWQIGKEAKRQLKPRKFKRELKRQFRAFGREAAHQLGTGWGEEFGRQIFGAPKRRRRPY
jgi:hypothetical protein